MLYFCRVSLRLAPVRPGPAAESIDGVPPVNTHPSPSEAGAHLHARFPGGASPARSTPGFTPGAHRAFIPARFERTTRDGQVTIVPTFFVIVPRTAREYARMEREERLARRREQEQAKKASELAAFRDTLAEPTSSNAPRERIRNGRRHKNKR